MEMQQIVEKLLDVNILLELNLSLLPCHAQMDAGDFNDALLNLCTNAKHAMPMGGRLNISTEVIEPSNEEKQILQLQEDDYIKLSISDTGTGMDETVIAKIFDPFYTTKGEQGTGLGMAQVYSFMQRSNGAISVDSTIGYGTSIYLYFPLSSVLSPDTA